MNQEIAALLVSAASIGVIHTLLGPDHYIPFIALAKARNWTTTRMAVITALCGVGHVLGSVVLGLVGVVAGTAVFHLESIESVRGDLAANRFWFDLHCLGTQARWSQAHAHPLWS